MIPIFKEFNFSDNTYFVEESLINRLLSYDRHNFIIKDNCFAFEEMYEIVKLENNLVNIGVDNGKEGRVIKDRLRLKFIHLIDNYHIMFDKLNIETTKQNKFFNCNYRDNYFSGYIEISYKYKTFFLEIGESGEYVNNEGITYISFTKKDELINYLKIYHSYYDKEFVNLFELIKNAN